MRPSEFAVSRALVAIAAGAMACFYVDDGDLARSASKHTVMTSPKADGVELSQPRVEPKPRVRGCDPRGADCDYNEQCAPLADGWACLEDPL